MLTQTHTHTEKDTQYGVTKCEVVTREAGRSEPCRIKFLFPPPSWAISSRENCSETIRIIFQIPNIDKYLNCMYTTVAYTLEKKCCMSQFV